MNKFWLVWNKNGNAPTYEHQSEYSARKEAERLSRLNKGEVFHVLELIDSGKLKDVKWSSDEFCDDIPF